MNKPKMFYFGPWDQAGHFLCGEHGSHVRDEDRKGLPWNEYRGEIDGALQPHRSDCRKRNYCGCPEVEGQALLHHKDGWTALSFWDRTVDTRGKCNSTYFAEGTFTFDEMVAMAKERFAHRWNKMRFQVVLAGATAPSKKVAGEAPAPLSAPTKGLQGALWLCYHALKHLAPAEEFDSCPECLSMWPNHDKDCMLQNALAAIADATTAASSQK